MNTREECLRKDKAVVSVTIAVTRPLPSRYPAVTQPLPGPPSRCPAHPAAARKDRSVLVLNAGKGKLGPAFAPSLEY